MNLPFLGRGWSFPPDFNRVTNGVTMLEGEADIASSLEVLLSTAMGERIMLPEYGCNLDELIFEELDTRIKTLIADKVETAILYHESRITVESINLDDRNYLDGVVLIEIIYVVKTTNSRYNVVFPYYITQGTDLNLSTLVNLLPSTV